MAKRVAILGGGVGGLSAAHELIERGFAVAVFERRDAFGGKARSIPVSNTGQGGSKDLPGEHGFRFFPGFYRHLPDTMKRIPYAGNRSVFENLVEATRMHLARAGQAPIILTARIPQSIDEWVVAIQEVFKGIGVSDEEVRFFAERMFVLLTSCRERMDTEYEHIPWWTFIDAANHSAAYQTLLGKGLTRSLVAVRAQEASTRTAGTTMAQLLYGLLTLSGFDRLLNGPTSDVWLTPWVSYLRQQGVDFQGGTTIQALHASGAGITSVTADTNSQSRELTADYYISALPVEVMTPLVDAAMKSLAPSLANIEKLRTAWMNGIQFYLAEDVPLEFGHSLYADSPWALTSISQRQFWNQVNLAQFGDGKIGGILSVDISAWETPGILYGKTAMQCSAEEIEQEVWTQIKQHVNVGGTEVLRDDNMVCWFLDPDVVIPNPGAVMVNLEPLMINISGSLQFRPNAFTEIPNLFLTSDYVKTNTDVACMEAANEAARRAVNALLDREGSSAARVPVWPLKVPEILQPFIDYDRLRFLLGVGHVGSKQTWWGKTVGRLYGALT